MFIWPSNMNRTETIDALVNAAVTEISMNGSLALLKEFVRSGFHGFAQMTNEQLRRELSF